MEWLKLEPGSGPFITAVTVAAIGTLVLLGVLHFMPNQVKRWVTISATFVAGLYYFLEFFLPPDPETEEVVIQGFNLTESATVVGNFNLVILGFTFLLGIYNLVYIHGRNIQRLKPDWQYSVAFFVAFVAMTGAAFAKDWQKWVDPKSLEGDNAVHWVPTWIHDHAAEKAGTLEHDLFTFLFEGLYRNLEATMFSILAFYIVSAAYRAFRIRSGEAAVLMIVALILMMGQVPLGMAVTAGIPSDGIFAVWRIEELSLFILKYVNGPVQRAIGFGVGLGSLAMALRIWLSLERGTYFGEDA